MSEMLHHTWGPSSLKQKINCLASAKATEGLPNTDSEAALSGTATHALVETCRERDEPAKKYLGSTIPVRREDGTFQEFLVDQARVDSAQKFIDHMNGLPGIDFNEQLIHYPRFIPGGFGTLDGARAPNTGTVYLRDFKDGGLLVYAKDNEQLLGQALGFYEDWGHLFEIKEFNLGIIQPRRDHEDFWPNVSVEYVLAWGESVLKPAYARAHDPNPPYNPGEWCTFCKIKGTCKARAAQTFETAVDEFDDLDDAIEKSAKVAFTGQLSNDQIARILPVIPTMKAWCNDIERYAFAEVRAGRKVGTMKIVEGSLGDRKWIGGAEQVIVHAAADNLEVDVEQLYEPRTLRGPAQVEKVLGKRRFKPATDKKPAGDMHHLITRPKGRPILVGGDDERPPMVFDAAEAFDNVEDES